MVEQRQSARDPQRRRGHERGRSTHREREREREREPVTGVVINSLSTPEPERPDTTRSPARQQHEPVRWRERRRTRAHQPHSGLLTDVLQRPLQHGVQRLYFCLERAERHTRVCERGSREWVAGVREKEHATVAAIRARRGCSAPAQQATRKEATLLMARRPSEHSMRRQPNAPAGVRLAQHAGAATARPKRAQAV